MKQLQVEALLHYEELVRRYHQTLDLISPLGLAELGQKIEEALPYLNLADEALDSGGLWLDVGSGAGLPAIPLAIACTKIHFTLLERRRKRGSFLEIVRSQLKLENVQVVQTDVRLWRSSRRFRWISAQAFGSFAKLYCLTRHLHEQNISLLARKGTDWNAEVDEVSELTSVRPIETREILLPSHGRLVKVTMAGGRACPSSG